MDLPFELKEYHKANTKFSWKRYKLNMDNFEEIYNKYIYATKCELCNKVFQNTRERHMDHNHETGEFRNIVCQNCNQRKFDRKKHRNNTSGYQYISKHKDKLCKQGFVWDFQVSIDKKQKKIRSSTDLNKLIEFRDQWFKDHPEYHT